jgi:hypothetical protein
MDWICAITTVISVELIARHKWQGWAVGVASQALWLVLIYQRHLWGLIDKPRGTALVKQVRGCWKTLYTLLFQHETHFCHFPKMP